ncbi:MAG: hypothetical protein FWD75_03410 [Propionibacteriaceae bacterium]|nr:hypothetical protein [Propionibacteriaceae bacterium]
MTLATMLIPRLPTRHRNRLTDIIVFHVCLAAFFLIIGFLLHELMMSVINPHMPVELSPTTAIGISSTRTQLVAIWLNNIAFFLIVSVLPIVGSAMAAVQFILLGGLIHGIRHLPLSTQTDLLFRHAGFEVVALLAAVTISYILLMSLNEFLRTSEDSARSTLLSALSSTMPFYALIFTTTTVGAILEGSAVVQL